MKVALTLAREVFVDSLRGRGGGLRLAMAPQRIVLGAVVRKTEDSFDLVECFDAASNTCVIAPGCRLKQPLAAAAQAFLAVLDGYTLADLTASPATARTPGRLRPADRRAGKEGARPGRARGSPTP